MHVFKFCSLHLLLCSTFLAQVHGVHIGHWSDALNFFDRKIDHSLTKYLQVAHRTDRFSKDFWGDAVQLGDRVQKYTIELIQNAAGSNATVAIKLAEFKDTMTELVSSVKVLREAVQDAGANPHDISEKLSIALETVLEELKSEFPAPDNAPHHDERVVIISRALAKTTDSLVHVLSFAIPEADIKEHSEVIEQHVKALLVLAGDLIEQHPVLFKTLLFSGAILCIPEIWLLRPFLSLFGFGPSGPVKGSVAAWAQRRFWGATVAESSWFAYLQSAAMKFPALKWWEKIIPAIIAVGGMTWSLMASCHRHR